MKGGSIEFITQFIIRFEKVFYRVRIESQPDLTKISQISNALIPEQKYYFNDCTDVLKNYIKLFAFLRKLNNNSFLSSNSISNSKYYPVDNYQNRWEQKPYHSTRLLQRQGEYPPLYAYRAIVPFVLLCISTLPYFVNPINQPYKAGYL